MIDSEEVITPVVSASATFASLTLVFLGIVVTAYQSYAADVPQRVRRPYQVDGGLTFAGFLVGVVTVAVGLAWLVGRGTITGVFTTVLAGFAIQLVLTVVAAARVLRRVLWS